MRPLPSSTHGRAARAGQAGFSLIEALVATAITAFGVLGVAVLFLYGIGLQRNAADATAETNLAVAQLERLRMLPPASAERSLGGSLTANEVNHFAVVGQTTLRWVVADDVACGPVTWSGSAPVIECTKTIRVAAIPNTNPLAGVRWVTGMVWR